MERTRLLERLGDLDVHISRNEDQVARQRAFIESMGREHHDGLKARALLAQFEELLAMRLAERDRVLAELQRVTA